MHAAQNIGMGASGGISYDGKIAGLYDLEETLGSGHFAVVKLARHVFTGAKVAVKVVDKTKLDDVSKAHLFQEVRHFDPKELWNGKKRNLNAIPSLNLVTWIDNDMNVASTYRMDVDNNGLEVPVGVSPPNSRTQPISDLEPAGVSTRNHPISDLEPMDESSPNQSINDDEEFIGFDEPRNYIKSKRSAGKIAGLYDLEETLESGDFAVVKLARPMDVSSPNQQISDLELMDVSSPNQSINDEEEFIGFDEPRDYIKSKRSAGKIAGLYDLEETLGSGHFAVVKLARHVFTGTKVAVKVVDKTKLDDFSKAHLFQEVRCMKLVQHPNVVRLYEVIDTQTKLYLVLELGDGGDLYDYIMKHESGLNEELARKYFRQIVRAISYCHQLHVVHRDLKPENVVFFEKLGVVKLTDFGFSNKFSPGQKLETSCGSLAYSAPEILLGDSYDAPAVDIWSLGVILYMLVCGQPPFEKANDSETLTMIMDCKYTVPPHITVPCRNLIGSMLVRDPEKRSTLDQIAKHPWLQQNTTSDTIDYLPLVSRQELSEEDHAFIIQKMINGKIASKEEITQSLDKNQYNHITATYFLLGELRLRKRREEQSQKRFSPHFIPSSSSKKQNDVSRNVAADNKTLANESNKLVVPINIEVCSSNALIGESTQDKRNRKCSIVREEDEDEMTCEYPSDKYALKVAIPRRESISDGRLNQSVQERTNSIPPMVVPIKPSSKMTVSVDATLAAKLNQIEKQRDTKLHGAGDGNLNVTSVASSSINETLSGIKDLKINKLKHLSATSKNPVLTHRKAKLNKIRTPSCSSSEASDDDTKIRNKKKGNKFVGDTPVRFHMHRRDSHDDSSDSQDQTTFSSSAASHSNAGNLIASSANTGGKKGEQQQSKEKSKPEDTRKSSNSHSKQKKHSKDQDKQSHADKSSTETHIRRRRIRESQSLDRITEAQEYEQRCRYTSGCNLLTIEGGDTDQKNSLYNLNACTVAETTEEYDDDELSLSSSKEIQITSSRDNDSVQIKRNKNSISKLNSIDEFGLIIDVNSLTKAIQVTSSRCSVTMKKIRRLGKYFPVVNFS